MISTLPGRIYHHFPALKYRNYRLYFIGQLISFTGSWLHGVAHGWLVYQLTQSPFWLGAVSAIAALPVLLLSLYGGFLVDRFNRKKLLIGTQTASLLCALILGILTIAHLINLLLLLLLTFFAGIANAIDNPVTQAFVIDVVGKDDLSSAVGLNSTMFSTGRVLGPAAAGYLIALVGVGNIFLINAGSFLAILISLYFIRLQTTTTQKKENAAQAIKEGIFYAYDHPIISILLLTAGIGAIFCFSEATIMPVVAQKIFQDGARGLGTLLSAMGIGALIGSLIVSSQSKKFPASWFIVPGNILFLIFTFIFTFTTDVRIASICLFFSTLGLTIQFSTIYSSIQRIVREEFRGRVSSIYVLLFVGFSPLGNLFIGTICSLFGPQLAIRLCIFFAFLYGVVVALNLKKVKRKYVMYRQTKPAYTFAKTTTSHETSLLHR